MGNPKRWLAGALAAVLAMAGLATTGASAAETDTVSVQLTGSVTALDVNDALTFEINGVYGYGTNEAELPNPNTATANDRGKFTFEPVRIHKAGTYSFEIRQQTMRERVVICACGKINPSQEHTDRHILNGEDGGYEYIWQDDPSVRTDSRIWYADVTVTETDGTLSVDDVSYRSQDGRTGDAADFLTVTADVPETPADAAAKAQAVLRTLSLEEKVAQCFLVPYSGRESVSVQPGGYFFSRSDFAGGSVALTKKRVDYLQGGAKVPYLMATAEEGGSNSPASGLTAYRSMPFGAPQALAAKGASSVKSDAKAKGQFLASMGLNLNLGPVADSSNSSGYMYSRTYGGDGLTNAPFVKAAVSGMAEAGIGSALPHFPGYGSMKGNTATGTVTNNRTASNLEYDDALPFRTGIAAGADGLVVGHSVYAELTAGTPASLCPDIYASIRDSFRFDGLAITDNCSKTALAAYKNPELTALQAGADLIWTDNVSAIQTAVNAAKSGKLSTKRIDEAALRVLTWKAKRGVLDLDVEPMVLEATYASADGSVTDMGSFAEMWEKLESIGNGTVTLQADVATGTAFSCSGTAANRVLDLAGHTFRYTGTGAAFTVPAGHTLTLTDSIRSLTESEGTGTGYKDGVLTYLVPGETTSKTVKFNTVGRLVGAKASVLLYGTGGTIHVRGGWISGADTGIRLDSGELSMNAGAISGSKTTGILAADGTEAQIAGGYLAGDGTGIVNHGTTTVSGSAVIAEQTAGIVSDGPLTVTSTSRILKCSDAAIRSDAKLILSGQMRTDGTVYVNKSVTTLAGRIQAAVTLADGITMTSKDLAADSVVTVTTANTGDSVKVLRNPETAGIVPADGSYKVVTKDGGVWFVRQGSGSVPVGVTVNGAWTELGQISVTTMGPDCTVAESAFADLLRPYGYPDRALGFRHGGETVPADGMLEGGVYSWTMDDLPSMAFTLADALRSVMVTNGSYQATQYVKAGVPVTVELPALADGWAWTGDGTVTAHGDTGYTAAVTAGEGAITFTATELPDEPEMGTFTLTNRVIHGGAETFTFTLFFTDADGNTVPVELMKDGDTVSGNTVELADGESVTGTLPVGTAWSVTESGPDCETSVFVGRTETVGRTVSGIAGDDVRVEFQNRFSEGSLPETGGMGRTMVLGLGGLAAAIGILVLAAGRKRKARG